MAAKIFPDSANVWQDQAKVLFNYYRQCAERVVSEEERIEQEINNLEEEKQRLADDLSSHWWLLLLLVFPYFLYKNRINGEIAEADEHIEQLRQAYQAIFRDYRVSKLGVAYVPVAEQVRYQDKSFIVDYTGSVPESQISMSMSRQNQLLVDTIHRLDALSKEAPVVETSEEAETVQTDEYSLSIQEIKENDYVGDMERSLRTVAFCMDDLETVAVSLPVVLSDSPFLPELDSYATTQLPQGAMRIDVFDNQAYQPAIERFRDINQLKNSLSNETSRFEEVLKELMQAIGISVQTIARMKVASVDKVVLESNGILYQILKAPYNHYSPVLEAEEIERIRHEEFNYSDDIQGYEPFTLRQSSRVRFNPLTRTWIAEDGSQTVSPFGVHQIYEEIVAPMVQNLMQENRIERLKIYNHIRDQKISYLNKWHQDTDAFYRANRAESADLINLMQQTLTEYVAAYNNLLALQRTEAQMAASGEDLDSMVVNAVDNSAETLSAFELQGQEFQKCQSDFEDYIDRLKEDIDLKAARFGHVEYYDAKLRDGYSNSVAVAAAEVDSLDERRRGLATVNPKLAKDSELPPRPHISETAEEHFSLNLPSIVAAALENLNVPEEPAASAPAAPVFETPAAGAPMPDMPDAPVAEMPAPEAPAATAPEAPAAPAPVPPEAPAAPAPADDDIVIPEYPIIDDDEIREYHVLDEADMEPLDPTTPPPAPGGAPAPENGENAQPKN